MFKNSGGTIWYGLHMLPGVAQYSRSEQDPQRIFINEDTIRKMDTTFAGKPVFVEHVNEVDQDLNQLRKEADGWVIESFFNAADGKHWVKFITVSDNAERAIKNGYRLSNAYLPRLSNHGGMWNAVPYQNEVIDGEYEHLAIVKEPRYEESKILTPDQFKAYNDSLQSELKKIANAKENPNMMTKLKFWQRKPLENDLSNVSVTLPKSGKEMTIAALVNAMDWDASKDAYGKSAPETKHKMENIEHEDKGIHKAEHGQKDEAPQCNHREFVKDCGNCYDNMFKEHGEMKNKLKNREEHSEVDLELEEMPLDVEGDLKNEDEEESAVIEEHKKEKHGGPSKSRGEQQREQGDGKDYEEKGRASAQRQKDGGSEPSQFPKKQNDEDNKEDVETLEAERKKKMKNSEHFNTLKNAHLKTPTAGKAADFGQLERGKVRYGSNKF